MSGSLLILVVALLVATVAGGYIYVKRRERKRKISLILDGVDRLAYWTYTPDEWRRAVEDEFTWVRNKDNVGQVHISSTAIYVKNDSQDRLIDLIGEGKVVTHASYRGAEGSSLKLRVRWKVIIEHQDRSDEVKYYKEDYRIPVPLKHKEDAGRVAQFFTAQLENNLEAYTAVVPEDEPISLFGRDSF